MNIDLTFFQSILAFLLILTPIVFVHELGHFMFARIFGVHVEIFSIGFGPVLYSFNDKRHTRWQIAAIPIGGFVKMRGELNINPETPRPEVKKGSFEYASPLQRLLIVFAGPLFNFFLTVVLIAGIYLFFGKVEVTNVVNDVIKGSPAEQSGIIPNDKIVSINNIKVKNFEEIRQIIFESPEAELEFGIIRNEKLIQLNVKPESKWSEELKINIGKVGIISNSGFLKTFGFSESLYNSFIDTVFITKSMIRGIIKLLSGNVQKGEIGGPVRIAELSGQALISGVVPLIFFGALISLNLGLVNLLPIPALDGGHIVLYIVEIFLGKPLPIYFQNLLMRGGISLLLALMLLITINDISRFF